MSKTSLYFIIIGTFIGALFGTITADFIRGYYVELNTEDLKVFCIFGNQQIHLSQTPISVIEGRIYILENGGYRLLSINEISSNITCTLGG